MMFESLGLTSTDIRRSQADSWVNNSTSHHGATSATSIYNQSRLHKSLHLQSESKFARAIVIIVRTLLFIYDILSLPIYFVLQRPDKRAREAQSTRSERVDINTWVKIIAPIAQQDSFNLFGRKTSHYDIVNHNYGDNACLISDSVGCSTVDSKVRQFKYMGSTVSEIFANSIKEYASRSCLGYRAVVTCPVMVSNPKTGEHVFEDKSFRSDYTWYTYEQIGRRVHDTASGLYQHGAYPEARVFFFASTSLEWFCMVQASFQLALQVVVAPEVTDIDSLKFILNESRSTIMMVSCDRIGQICQLFDNIRSDEQLHGSIHITRIVVIDWQFSIDLTEPAFAQLQDACQGVVDEIVSMGQIEEIGVENPIKLLCTNSLREENETGRTGAPLNNIDQNRLSPIWRRKLDEATISNQFTLKPRRQTMDSEMLNKSSKVRSKLAQNSLLLDAQRAMRSGGSLSRPNNLSLQWLGSSEYLVDNQHQVDSKSSTPRLSPKFTRIVGIDSNSNTHQSFESKPRDVAMVVYTHRGPLGQIRALTLTHSNLARCSHQLFLDGMLHARDVHCTTLPLDNVIELMVEMCVISRGGAIGYSCNKQTLFYDGKHLFEKDRSDLEALSPTFMLARPYMLESLRASLQNYLILHMNPLRSFLLTNVLYEYKKYWARYHFETPIVDRLFCHEMKQLFGRKIKYILCNGTTDCRVTKDFFAFMCNIPVIELYGADEAVISLVSVNDIWDYKRRAKIIGSQAKWWQMFHSIYHTSDSFADIDSEPLEDFRDIQLMPPRINTNEFREDLSKNLLITSSIMCPSSGTRIRLEDWEDFRTSDKPYPRGRLVIGGDMVCKGYFGRPELSKQCFYVDCNFISWFRTNDLARVFPNGSFEIISAMSDLTKMRDGQFISLSQVEHILRDSQFVDNACAICGDDIVVVLVVPNLRRLALKSPGEANLKMAIGLEPEPEELLDIEFRREVCNDRFLTEFVTTHLNELIAKAGLRSIQTRFHLVPEIWTPETELVTSAFEPKRSAIQKFYSSDIQSVFRMTLRKNRRSLSASLRSSRPRPLLQS